MMVLSARNLFGLKSCQTIEWLQRCRCTAWTLRISLIEQVRDAVWAAVLRLKGTDQPPVAA